ncbi:MAG: gliding motility-associated C-terminal domain-containing protein [Saprospiraceae bacterium]|nr:gliding motility-associated C-terminal domain-containing protein [Saprospiraceae bacterium]
MIGKQIHATGKFADGCSCPQTMTFTRTMKPAVLTPCSEFEITYTILNHSGIGKTGVTFKDSLPDLFTITEVVEHTFNFGQIVSGEGSSYFNIDNLDILIGRNTIRLKGLVGTHEQTIFETQAVLLGLPLGLGTDIWSDNPATFKPADANRVEILHDNNFKLADYLQFNCSKDTAMLSLPFPANTYEWSDGSSEATLQVTKTGTYAVIASSDCFTVQDSIQITAFPEPPTLELGETVVTQQNRVIQLLPQTNANIISFEWSSFQPFDLSCQNCFTPTIRAIWDNTYYLTATTEEGCILEDSVQVQVIPVRAIYAANTFSPNGDATNDIFYLVSSSEIATIMRFQVFDRWGNRVFQHSGGTINDPNCGWNGQYQGQTVEAGTYIWLAEIEFLDGELQQLQGEVSLVKY